LFKSDGNYEPKFLVDTSAESILYACDTCHVRIVDLLINSESALAEMLNHYRNVHRGIKDYKLVDSTERVDLSMNKIGPHRRWHINKGVVKIGCGFCDRGVA